MGLAPDDRRIAFFQRLFQGVDFARDVFEESVDDRLDDLFVAAQVLDQQGRIENDSCFFGDGGFRWPVIDPDGIRQAVDGKRRRAAWR